MTILVPALAFGCIVGSFLNVVIHRLHAGGSVVGGRSRCPGCRHVLSAVDLVPVLSYLLLHGRCRHCRVRISPVYPAVEIVTGILFALAAVASSGWPQLVLNWFVLSSLVVVFVYDWRHMLIPRAVVLPAAGIAAVTGLLLGVAWWSLALGVAVTAGFFWLQRLLSRGRWIGGGDVNLGLLMGASLGWPNSLAALFLAYVSGAAVAVLLLSFGRRGWRGELPFGTFLSAATAVSLLYGDAIVSWYLNLL
ncbi:MAG: prepilin peptidase [bacterium]